MDQRNFAYMFYGFAAAWVVIAVYVLTLVSRERRIARQVQDVRRMLEEREQK
jgi:CcmD family protein